MNKFWAIVKREYVQRVRSKMFIVMTIIGPLMLAVFTVVPGLMLSMKTSDTRVAIVDLTPGKKLSNRVRASLLRHADADELPQASDIATSMNANARDRLERAGKAMRGSFLAEDVDAAGRSLTEIKQELNARIGNNQ